MESEHCCSEAGRCLYQVHIHVVLGAFVIESVILVIFVGVIYVNPFRQCTENVISRINSQLHHLLQAQDTKKILEVSRPAHKLKKRKVVRNRKRLADHPCPFLVKLLELSMREIKKLRKDRTGNVTHQCESNVQKNPEIQVPVLLDQLLSNKMDNVGGTPQSPDVYTLFLCMYQQWSSGNQVCPQLARSQTNGYGACQHCHPSMGISPPANGRCQTKLPDYNTDFYRKFPPTEESSPNDPKCHEDLDKCENKQECESVSEMTKEDVKLPFDEQTIQKEKDTGDDLLSDFVCYESHHLSSKVTADDQKYSQNESTNFDLTENQTTVKQVESRIRVLTEDDAGSTQPTDPDIEHLSAELDIKVSPDASQIEEDNQTATSDGEDEESDPKWDAILKLYEKTEGLLNMFPWIAGCSVSSEEVEVMINVGSDVQDTGQALQDLKDHISPDLHQYLRVTDEGPSLEPCSYGSGDKVTEMDEAGVYTRYSTVSLVGMTENQFPKTYGFTVGHGVDEEKRCEVQGQTDQKACGRCIMSINNTNGEEYNNVKHKIYDIALIEMDQVLSQANGRTIYIDREKRLNVVPYKGKVTLKTVRIGTKVLIHGGPERRTHSAKLQRFYFDPQPNRVKYSVNFAELVSDGPRPLTMKGGHSGSLVTSHPDKDNTVKALLYVGGHMKDHPETAWALPLWDTLTVACDERPRMKEMLKNISFDDYDDIDTGYMSQ